MVVLLESLSRRQRELTPILFAHHLVMRVREITGSYLVAALWVRKDSPYREMVGVDCWGIDRDAWRYCGPYPVICHPPCGPWGRYHHRCRQDYMDGVMAMHLVRELGGVVEQPASSRLFREWAEPFLGEYQRLRQGDWGHPATKDTVLYWVRRGRRTVA